MKNLFKKIIIPILTWQAMHLLGRFNPKIIAITGSVGKTSTREAIKHFLEKDFDVRASQKSYNTEIGIPLTILGLKTAWADPLGWTWNITKGFFTSFFSKEYPDVLVLEVGADRPGDIGRTVSWLSPDIAVLTSLPEAPVHVENFPSVAAVHEEKLKLLKALPKDGVAVVNSDDSILMSLVSKLHLPHLVLFGMKHQDGIVLPEFGSPYPVLAAAVVAKLMNVAPEDIRESARSFETPAGRLKKLPGIRGSTLIDDTYNASPIAVQYALEVLKRTAGYERKIAVLGDMRELGALSEQEHRKVGRLATRAADLLLAVGDDGEFIADAAEKSGMKKEHVICVRNSVDAGEYLKNILKSGDLVLLKGSQGVRMEKAILPILNNPEKNKPLLVRQDKEWKRR